MIDKLNEFVDLVERGTKLGNPWKPEQRELTRKMEESDPNIRKILNHVRPGLGDYKRTSFSGWINAKKAAQQGVGILREQDELDRILQPDTPSIPAGQLHHWVWSAAQSFWESEHYSSAVEQAWKSINAHLQSKTGRRDLSDDDLVNQTLSEKDPKTPQPRLRVPGDKSTQTWSSRQRGLHTLGQACVAGIRNVVAHEADLDLDPQIALELLATLSTLARWIDEADVVDSPQQLGLQQSS